jgi:hypothetical protein
MKARVSNYPGSAVVAFGGLEYVKNEWRIVPVANEAEVERHPYLEVLEEKPEAVAAPEVEPTKVIDIHSLKVAELRQFARNAGIDTKGMKKVDLIAALEELDY